MTSGIGPADVAVALWRWFWIGIGVLVLAGVLVLGMWQAGWWFAGHNAGRQAHMIRNGYSNQQTLREQITQQIANVATEDIQIAQSAGNPAEIAALKSQRIATVNLGCQDASEVTGDPLPAQQAAWVTANCLAGSIRPRSQYDSTGDK